MAGVRKLHSLSGVVPIGAFLLLHIWTTLSIVGSSEVYDRQVAFLHGGPVLGFLEVVLVLIPLAYHGLYGIVRSLQRTDPADPPHAYDSSMMVTLQRLSGVVILVFVALHTWEFRGQTWTNGLPVASYSTTLIGHLSSTQVGVPWIAFGYLVGLAASFFHLVNGMTSFFTTWGFTKTPESQRRARVLFRIAGSFFFAVSALMVVQLATGARYFPSEPPKSPATACGTDVPPPPPPPTPPSASGVSPLPARDH